MDFRKIKYAKIYKVAMLLLLFSILFSVNIMSKQIEQIEWTVYDILNHTYMEHPVADVMFYYNISFSSGIDVNKFIMEMEERNRMEEIYVFYDQYTRNRNITELLIEKAIEKEIPVNKLFALSNIESSFIPESINKNINNSIDYGLFQLNSKSFPHYSSSDLLNIHMNVDLATDFIKNKYEYYGNWEETFIAYNAGNTNKVHNSTIKYFVKLQECENKIDKNMNNYF